jgi:hypothetical protein
MQRDHHDTARLVIHVLFSRDHYDTARFSHNAYSSDDRLRGPYSNRRLIVFSLLHSLFKRSPQHRGGVKSASEGCRGGFGGGGFDDIYRKDARGESTEEIYSSAIAGTSADSSARAVGFCLRNNEEHTART